MNRVAFCLLLLSGLAASAVEYRIQLDTISDGFDKETCWVHPRAGAIPGASPSVVLTMQKLLLTGSDIFYAINDMRTDDLGRTWSAPAEHATLARRQGKEGMETQVCDFWPKWHAKSQTLLGIGHTAYYLNNHIAKNRPRETAYSIYDPKARTWSEGAILAMPAEDRFHSAGAGCAQRVDLPNGDILLPIYFKAKTDKQYRSTVVRCGFDGKKLTYLEDGNEVAVPIERGAYEPSLTTFQGRYFLTIRNDRAGYVARSDDGLQFPEPKVWCWDDGTELGNYNTQQHWVTHSDGLFLVYTRTGAGNDHVFRHRAPLFIAQVDPEKLHVIRKTERILVPERGARLGNFGVTQVNENETWVTVSEWMQTWGPKASDYTIPMKYGSNNAVFAARIIWAKPNTTWNQQ